MFNHLPYVPTYFHESEFSRIGCSLTDLDPHSLRRLDEMRECYGKPIIVNSAFRSIKSERSKGRSGTSAHCLGRAFDLACSNSHDRFLMVRAAISVGFTRIGIGKTFIHVDDSESHSQEVLWLY